MDEYFDCTGEEVGSHLCNCQGKMEKKKDSTEWKQIFGETGCVCSMDGDKFLGCYCDRNLGFYKVPQRAGCPCHTSRVVRCNEGAKFDAGHVCVNPAKPGVDDYNCDTWDYTLTWLLGGTIIIAAILAPLLAKWYKYIDAQVAKMEHDDTEKAESQL